MPSETRSVDLFRGVIYMPRKTKKAGLFDKLNSELGVTTSKEENNKLLNLQRAPKKEKVHPKFQDFEKNATHQLDLLYLPHEKVGKKTYKYLLVAVDNSSRLVDAQALTDRRPQDILTAYRKILGRKYLSRPSVRIETDPGTEFQGAMSAWMNKMNINHKVGRTGRSRQQALVEYANRVLGKIITTKQNVDELRTGESSVDWVQDIPRIIQVFNKHVGNDRPSAEERIEDHKPPQCSGKSCALMEMGDRVRVVKEKPSSLVNGKRLHGKFRSGDTRWENTIRTITKVQIRPGSVPLYTVSGISNALFPAEQLQKIKGNEVDPAKQSVQGRFIPEKIVSKKKIKGRVHYEVKWKGWASKHNTFEAHSKFSKDRPDLVKEFNSRRR